EDGIRDSSVTGVQTCALPISTQPAADRTTTALGTAIRQAIAAYRGQPLAGVLLITDGQSNAGEPPLKAAEYAGSEGIPVVALARSEERRVGKEDRDTRTWTHK